MKKLLAILVLLSFVCTPCYSNSSPTIFPSNMVFNNSFELIFQVAFFDNNSFPGDVCADGVNEEVAELLCNNFGPFDGAIANNQDDYSTDPLGIASYTNLTCPNGLPSCNAARVDSNCSDYGGLLLVQCTVELPDCLYNGQIQFESAVNTTNGSFTYLSGHPNVCVNDSSIPICASAQGGFSDLDIQVICSQMGFLRGYVGTPPGVPPLTDSSDSNDTVVVTEFSCSSYSDCSPTTEMGHCDDPMRYATVTCHNDTGPSCGQSGVSFLNSTRIVSGGQETVTGIPLICVGGQYTVLCNESTRAQQVSSLLCDLLGFETGSLLSPNPALYGMVPQGSFYNYATNFTCPTNVTAIENCSANPIFNSRQCQSGALAVVVECSRPYTPSSTVVSITPSVTMATNGTSSSSNIGPIVGGVVGGVLVVAIIVIVVIVVIILLVVVKNKKKTVSPLETGTGGKKEAVELSKYKDVKA